MTDSTRPTIGLDNLFFNGSIVDLDIGVWGARTKLRPADLGIDPTEDVRKVLHLGVTKLAPRERFEDLRAVSRRATLAVEQYSVNFAMIRGARYVPNNNLPKLIEDLKLYRSAFQVSVDVFMDGYEAMKLEHLPVIEKALREAAKTPLAAQEAYTRLFSEYPSADAVRSKFNLSWFVYSVQGARSPEAQSMAEEETENVRSIVREMVEQLRGDFSDRLSRITDTVRKGGKLKRPQVDAANSTIERLESLNILGDSTLRNQLQAFKTAMSGELTENDVGGLEQIQLDLDTSLEEAVQDAERTLAGFGNRQLEV